MRWMVGGQSLVSGHSLLTDHCVSHFETGLRWCRDIALKSLFSDLLAYKTHGGARGQNAQKTGSLKTAPNLNFPALFWPLGVE